jgi:hypothetical protein
LARTSGRSTVMGEVAGSSECAAGVIEGWTLRDGVTHVAVAGWLMARVVVTWADVSATSSLLDIRAVRTTPATATTPAIATIAKARAFPALATGVKSTGR